MNLPEHWTFAQVKAFARAYQLLSDNQRLFVHPEAAEIPTEHWLTVAWNCAWIVADPIGEDETLVVTDTDTGEELDRERQTVWQ